MLTDRFPYTPCSRVMRLTALALGTAALACASDIGGPLFPVARTVDGIAAPGSWSVTQNGSVLEIAFGSGTNFPQYAALHLSDSYLRLNYGPTSGWGTSAILLPSYWTGGALLQGAPITATWQTVGENLVVSIAGSIGTLTCQGTLRFLPPGTNALTAKVSIDVTGNAVLDTRPGEAFKSVMLSSMHISNTVWDARLAFIDSVPVRLPASGWIVAPPFGGGKMFGLKGGTSTWKTNAPTIAVVLNSPGLVTGWVTPSSDPNGDSIGYWTATDTVVRSIRYTLAARK